MTGLDDVIARIEQATVEQQGGLLALAQEALFPPPRDETNIQAREAHTDRLHTFRKMLAAEAYESAALTLVPEGKNWTLQSNGGPGPMAFVDYCGRFQAGATPALAICIAALKAKGTQP